MSIALLKSIYFAGSVFSIKISPKFMCFLYSVSYLKIGDELFIIPGIGVKGHELNEAHLNGSFFHKLHEI